MNELLGDNRRLRVLLFYSHSHNGSSACLYDDDGEMQCSACGCDFVRDTAMELERKIYDWNKREFIRLGIIKEAPNAKLTGDAQRVASSEQSERG